MAAGGAEAAEAAGGASIAAGLRSMTERLAFETMDSLQQQGGAWKRKDDIYRMAQANKAFAHYRW